MSDLGTNVGSAPPRCSNCEMEHHAETPCVRAVAWWVNEALARIARLSDDIYGRNKTVLRQASEVSVRLAGELANRIAALDAKPEPPKPAERTKIRIECSTCGADWSEGHKCDLGRLHTMLAELRAERDALKARLVTIDEKF